jgi:hypothetical protein
VAQNQSATDNHEVRDADDGSVDGRWRAAHGSTIDTTIEPAWVHTGYRYFPFAALQDGQWWTLRANYCFPTHDLMTLFIDDAAVADATASPKDARPLVASIGRLSMTRRERAAALPVMGAALARRVVAVVAPFINYRSEWGDPCDLCEFAERSPFQPTDGATGVRR